MLYNFFVHVSMRGKIASMCADEMREAADWNVLPRRVVENH